MIKWIVAGIVFLLINVTMFFFTIVNPVTFTELSQNPEQTMQKYERIWSDETVREEPYFKKEYRIGDIVGSVTIPSLEVYEMPIYYGTTDENKNWQITTPGYEGNWQLFGEYGLAALGAHNYQLFQELDSLIVGNKFIIETADDIYVYEVKESGVFDAATQVWDDFVYTGKQPYGIDIITCYPFDAVDTSNRYVVYAEMCRGTIFIEEEDFDTESNTAS